MFEYLVFMGSVLGLLSLLFLMALLVGALYISVSLFLGIPCLVAYLVHKIVIVTRELKDSTKSVAWEESKRVVAAKTPVEKSVTPLPDGVTESIGFMV